MLALNNLSELTNELVTKEWTMEEFINKAINIGTPLRTNILQIINELQNFESIQIVAGLEDTEEKPTL